MTELFNYFDAMKRTLKLALAAFLAVIASVSCTKEQAGRQPETKVDGMKTIKIVSDVVTKTTLGNNDQPLWKVDDAIAVYDGNSEETVNVIAVKEGGKEGTFLVPDTYGDLFYAVYPENALWGWDLNANTDNATYVATVDLCSYDGSFGMANIAVGQSEGDKVYLKNAVALLEVTGLPSTGSLSLSKYSTALMDVYFKGEELLTFAAAEQPENLEFIGIDVEDKDVAYYIPVFPGTKTEELELTFTTKEGDLQVLYLKTGVILKRNTVYPVAWRETKVTAQKYEDIKTALENDETYSGIASDVPVQVEMTMDDANDGDNIIAFPVKTEGKAIAIALNGTAPNGDIIIKNDNDAKSPATLLITAPENTSLDINTPNTHVILNGKEYKQVKSASSASTLVISKDVTVDKLILVQGGLEVHGELKSVEIADPHGEIVVRDCEGLNATVYPVLRPHIAAGYKAVEKGGYYDIVPSEGVAKIGATAYASLEEAIAAVKDNETITLLTNVTDAKGMKVDTKKTFTIDFAGHTYTVNRPGAGSTNTQTQAFQLLKDQTITFMNGTINCAAENKDHTWDTGNKDAVKGIAMIIQDYAGLTLENMTIDGTNIAHNGNNVRYMVSSNYGDITFAGNTSIIAPAGDIAFDAYDNKAVDGADNSYPGAPTVTWNSTGTVNGGIELSGGTFVVAKNLAVSVPVLASEGESTLEIGTGATLSSASDFNDPNPNLKNHKSTAPVQVKQGAGLTICGAGKVEGINNTYSAVIVSINGDDDTKTAKLTVNGNVTLEGNYYGIVGNGNRHKTEILVNGGTIKGVHSNDNIGIYHPQAGNLTITGGTIEGYSSAVEVRGGTVDITGGSLKSTATAYKCTANGNGNTTEGAALAISQHSTKKPLTVTLSGGTFEGVRAVALEDPLGNKDAENINVLISGGNYTATEYAVFNNYAGTTINISDGTFESTGASGITVYARLGNVNITGGTFENNSNSEATIHVGCPAADHTNGPKLTISGNQLPVGGGLGMGMGIGDSTTAAKTIVRNKAEGQYSYNSELKPLVVNMANELEYKAVTIENGWFYGQNPEKDDSYTGTDASNHKWFLGDNRIASWEEDHWEIALNGNPGQPIWGD